MMIQWLKKVFKNKNSLNEKKLVISEILTVTCMQKFSDTKEIHDFKNIWTLNRKNFHEDALGKIKLF